MEANVASAFGAVLKALRIEKGLTQEQLGMEAGLQRQYISMLELGTRAPSLAVVLRIAKGLKLEPGTLVSSVATKVNEL